MDPLEHLRQVVSSTRLDRRYGNVTAIGAQTMQAAGLSRQARLGDFVEVSGSAPVLAEVIGIASDRVTLMPYSDCSTVRIGDPAGLLEGYEIAPAPSWSGRILDALARPIDDGAPLQAGPVAYGLKSPPPPAVSRRPLGQRIRTGIGALDTVLPLARGQRVGVFAGSGVGKTSLLAEVAREAQVDHIVFALIGERGRELMHFVNHVLGPEGLARAVLVCATSDQSPLMKRRAAWTAMTVAEGLRDQGSHVLLIVDSVTRMAEAHREIALTAGEPATLGGHPPSLGALIAGYAERAGPGGPGQGDITAIFSVLVAASDMDEPVADITRGVLDGHIVLDREIAERGRFPAIDVRRSVSRSLPDCASATENGLIRDTRRVLGAYEAAEPMIQAGLYVDGSDPGVDRAKAVWTELDRFFETTGHASPEAAFEVLSKILEARAPTWA